MAAFDHDSTDAREPEFETTDPEALNEYLLLHQHVGVALTTWNHQAN
jgi:hypothetical protein